jgi:hypothetical protein
MPLGFRQTWLPQVDTKANDSSWGKEVQVPRSFARQIALNLEMIGRPITLKLCYQKDRANIVRIQKAARSKLQ